MTMWSDWRKTTEEIIWDWVRDKQEPDLSTVDVAYVSVDAGDVMDLVSRLSFQLEPSDSSV